MLKITNPNIDFLVCKYAYKEGLGGVLLQEGCIICYESKKLNEHEINYVTHDLELAAIVHTLKMWRHYLLGRRFVLMTDHYGLRYLFDQPKLNARQARWMAFLSEFDFEIKHVKGKENKVANFRKQLMWDLIGHTAHKTHMLDFSYSTSSSQKLMFKFAFCNNVG